MHDMTSPRAVFLTMEFLQYSRGPDFVLGSENRDETHLPVLAVPYRLLSDRHSQPVSSALRKRRATGAPGHRVTIFLC